MKKFKEWTNLNSWWLPWFGVIASISGLIFPGAFLKMGELITAILQLFRRHWRFSLIVCWGIYTHLEVLKLKNKKSTSEKKPRNNVC